MSISTQALRVLQKSHFLTLRHSSSSNTMLFCKRLGRTRNHGPSLASGTEKREFERQTENVLRLTLFPWFVYQKNEVLSLGEPRDAYNWGPVHVAGFLLAAHSNTSNTRFAIVRPRFSHLRQIQIFTLLGPPPLTGVSEKNMRALQALDVLLSSQGPTRGPPKGGRGSGPKSGDGADCS